MDRRYVEVSEEIETATKELALRFESLMAEYRNLYPDFHFAAAHYSVHSGMTSFSAVYSNVYINAEYNRNRGGIEVYTDINNDFGENDVEDENNED